MVAAVAITLVVAYQLYQVARLTGNYEGMWFSLAHTVIVACGVVLALRGLAKKSASTSDVEPI